MASSSSYPSSQPSETISNFYETTCMDSGLFLAAANGQLDVFKERVNELHLTALDLVNILTPEKNTVLHVNIITSESTEIFFAVKIVEMCPPLLQQTNARGETPLLLAARYGRHCIVQFLINRAKTLFEQDDLEKANAAVNNEVFKQIMRIPNQNKDTALHEAVRFNHLKVVRILTKEDPHFAYSTNEDGETPLYLAVEGQYLELVVEILQNCPSPATSGPKGRTVLHLAVLQKNTELVRRVLKKELNLTKQADDNGCIPLHYAVYSEYFEIVEMLLEKDKCGAYIKDKKGRTALHIAGSNHIHVYKMTKEILSWCPDSYEVVDNEGRNFLHYVVTRHQYTSNNIDVIKLLLEEYPSLTNYLLNRKDNVGNTPFLHMFSTSARFTPPKNIELMMSHPRVNKKLYNKNNESFSCLADNLGHTEIKKRGLEPLLEKYHISVFPRTLTIRVDGGEQRFEPEKAEERKKERKERIRNITAKYRESTLVAATLIATVTFTAGFTLPGGYISDEIGHPQQGSAVLRNNTAFQAFLITDTIAMVLSTISVFINLFLAITSIDEDDDMKLIHYYMISMLLTMGAMGLMVIAFVTGTYAVLSLSISLAIATCVIGLSFFVLLFFVVNGVTKHLSIMGLLYRLRFYRLRRALNRLRNLCCSTIYSEITLPNSGFRSL